MAIAASDFSERKRWQCGNKTVVRAKYTGPASYTAGGEVLTNDILKAAFGLTHADLVQCETTLGATFTQGAQLAFDHTPVVGTSQGKFHIIDQTGTNVGTEIVAAQTTFAAFTAWVTVTGY